MRLVKQFCFFVLSCMMLSAQTQDLPDKIDSINGDSVSQPNARTIIYPESLSLAAGDFVDVCAMTDAGGPYPITDSMGNTITQTTPVQTPAPQTTVKTYHAYFFTAFSGPDTITLTPGGGSTFTIIAATRFKHIGSVTVAVQNQTFAGNTSGGTGSFNTTTTTTSNNSILSSCGVPSIAGGKHVSLGNDSEYLTFMSSGNLVMESKRTGLIGNYTSSLNTWNDVAFGSHSTFAMQTIELIPTPTIFVADTKLPDAASGVNFEAQLHCMGGIAAQSYNLTGSLPAGISFNSTTGEFTGSSVITGTSSLSVTCTDGTSTSAAKALSLRVGAAFNTAAVFQSKGVTFGSAGGASGQTQTLNNPSVCGDYIHVLARGVDTHNTEGWLQGTSGNNFVSDSKGSPVRRWFGYIPGMEAFPIVDYIIGPLPSSGFDPVTIKNNQNASSGNRTVLMVEVSNQQDVVDEGAFINALTNTSTGSFLVPFQVQVPNTLLLVVTSTDSGAVLPVPTLAAPVTTLSFDSDDTGYTVFGWNLVAAAGLVNTTTNYTSGGAFTRWASLVIPIRSGLPSPACITTPVRHEAQIY